MKNKVHKLSLLGLMACTGCVPTRAMEQKKELSKIEQHKLNNDLSNAASNNNLEKVKECLKAGANIDVKDNHGFTPLMNAVNYGYTEITEILIQNGADIEKENNSNATALFTAGYWGRTQIAEILIHAGSNIHHIDSSRSTAFNVASQFNRTATATYLQKIENEFNNFITNPLQITNAAPKSAYVKMLYKNQVYFIDTTTLFKVCSDNNMKQVLKECKLFHCTKQEKKELCKSGFPITADEYGMKLKLVEHKNNHFKTDIYFE